MINIYSSESLNKINEEFYKFLEGKDLVLSVEESEDFNFLGRNANRLIKISLYLEEFIINLFSIKSEINDYQNYSLNWKKIYEFKRNFVQRRALREYKTEDVRDYKPDKIFSALSILTFATKVLEWLKKEDLHIEELGRASRYCAYKVYFDPDSIVFQVPAKLDYDKLLSLTNAVCTSAEKSMDHANYCIYCHNRAKDSCRTGIKQANDWQINPLGNKLTGCPLGQKVSEMNYLYSTGNVIASLAVVMIDNPLVAATGDRICNDCMKSCIYQKQEPVDIPCIETEMLKAVLSLPYGAEIYYLLSRWNPLIYFPEIDPALQYTTRYPTKNLIVGMGPAGFAAAYYLLKDGHQVVGIDGMAIQSLPEVFLKPIKNWSDTIKALGGYRPQGFGGVAEYGITDRWDKYNLLLIRMLLERFKNFEIRGNYRLGSEITIQKAIEDEKFDYIALCLGAGSPKVPEIDGINSRGVISAFQFLASLHMEAPDFKFEMPVVILGAGLTAIDCAMAAKAYYLKRGGMNLVDVTIIYRKDINKSPSYRENHTELKIALESGIKFIENTDLQEINLDKDGNIESINGKILAKTLVLSIGTNPNDKIMKTESEVFKLHKDKIGIFGDMDAAYAGTVVKAIASVKDWYFKR